MARLGICLNRLLLESLSTLTMYTLNLENAGMVLYCESFDRISNCIIKIQVVFLITYIISKSH